MANEKIAVLCKNEQEWEDTKSKAGKTGIMSWNSAKYYDDICVYAYDEHKGCDPQEACIRNGYTIITSDQYNTGSLPKTINKKIAVYCKTGVEWEAVKAKANLPGVADWGVVSHYGDICIYLDKRNCFDRRNDCLMNNYEVLTALEYLNPPRTTTKERAVLCETREEWNAVRRRAKKGKNVPDWDGLDHYNQKCIYVDSYEGFDEKHDCVSHGNTVISAEEYLKPVKKRGALGIDFNNIVAKISTKEEVIKPEPESMWKPIATAPKNKYIMVRGDSGMLTYPKFYVVAILNLEYRDDWININNDRLTDSGYVPEEWMEVPE